MKTSKIKPEIPSDVSAVVYMEETSGLTRRLGITYLALLAVGSLFVAIGVVFPYWFVTDSHTQGVYITCARTFKDCTSLQDVVLQTEGCPRSLTPILVLVTAAICSLFLSFILLGVYPRCSMKDMCKLTIAASVVAFLCLTVILLFASLFMYLDMHMKTWRRLGFAWYFTLAGNITLAGGLVCYIMNVHTNYLLHKLQLRSRYIFK